MNADLTHSQEVALQELERERGPAIAVYLLHDHPAIPGYPDQAPAEIAWTSARTLLDPDGTVVSEAWLPPT